jgi:hypothetical protein
MKAKGTPRVVQSIVGEGAAVITPLFINSTNLSLHFSDARMFLIWIIP